MTEYRILCGEIVSEIRKEPKTSGIPLPIGLVRNLHDKKKLFPNPSPREMTKKEIEKVKGTYDQWGKIYFYPLSDTQ